jgi:uncharacterized protein YfiM (DUF2279 family)
MQTILLSLLLMSADTGKVALATSPLAAPVTTVAIAEQDRWLGEDKFKHFAMSYMITATSFSVARTVTDRDASLVTGVALGAAAGILKELYDKRTKRVISARDLIWDAAGIATGILVAKQTR